MNKDKKSRHRSRRGRDRRIIEDGIELAEDIASDTASLERDTDPSQSDQ